MDGARDRKLLGSLVDHPQVDDWVSFTAEGRVALRTGKVELGQGIRTALTVIAADELMLDPGRIDVLGPSTDGSPDEGYTSGSRSIEQSGAAIRQACAHVLAIMVARASEVLGVPGSELEIDDGYVAAPDGRRTSYWDLAAGRAFDFEVRSPAVTRPAADHRWIGKGIPRVDLPAKIRGEPAFVQDMRLPGMRFARVVRPPCAGATLAGDVPDAVGEAHVVRSGSFVAVVADSEGEAAAAADALRPQLRWQGGEPIPVQAADPAYMAAHVTAAFSVVDGTTVDGQPEPPLDHSDAATVVRAVYTKPFLMHGSIGSSGAVARFDGDHLTIWSHSQGIGPLRVATAEALGIAPGAVTVHHVSGPGCYGHNGADDAAFDAALVAMQRPGEPISLRWSRADENGWEPLGPAMVVRLSAGIGEDGVIRSWDQDVLTYAHNSRPAPVPSGSRLLASWSLDPPAARARATPRLSFEAGGHRNANPPYAVGTKRIVKHEVDDGSLLRTSSMRSLGAFANVFASESFMDELAHSIGADPVQFRLDHARDPRARSVIEAVVDLCGGLEAPGGIDAPGRGIGVAQYENAMTYVAVVVEAEVSARTAEIFLRHAWIAADAGEVIDPDGLTNQLEGGFVQAASWTLKEQVLFGDQGVATLDWETYPILRFSEVPPIETRLIDRPEHRPVGAGEASCGPAAAAIANAVYQATGARVRELPLRPERVRSAIDALL